MSKANITEWERVGVLSLPTEVCVYLSAVAFCLLFVVVFYLYLSQPFCFKYTRRILCLAQHENDESEADSADDSNEASCDSDAEDLKRYRRIARHTSRQDSAAAAAAAAASEASLKKPFVKSSFATTSNCPPPAGSDVPPPRTATNATDTNATDTSIRATSTTATIDTTRRPIATTCAAAGEESNELDCENLTFTNEAFYCEGDDNNVEMTSRSKSKSRSGDAPSVSSTTYNYKDGFEVLEKEEPNDRRNRGRFSVVSNNTLDDDEDDEDTLSENPDEDQPSRCRSTADAMSSTRAPLPGAPPTVWTDPTTGADYATIARCGSLRLTFFYDGRRQRLSLVVHEAAGLPDYDDETTTSALKAVNYNTQVRMLLLPGRNSRHRTKIRTGDRPTYEETFHFKIKTESLPQMGIRLRLYGSERLIRLRLIGETIIAFANLDLHPPPLLPISSIIRPSITSSSAAAVVGLPSVTQWFVLEPRYNVTQSESMVDLLKMMRLDQYHSTSSRIHGEPPPSFQSEIPQLLIGLSYNEVTGRLSVEIIRGYSFTSSMDTRSPDTYVKMTLMSPEGQEMGSSKTSVRRGKPSPFYGETFMFSVAQFQLPDVSLMVSVYNIGTMKRRHMMGWFTLGYTNSTEYELEHWNEMRDCKGEQVTQWHLLLEP